MGRQWKRRAYRECAHRYWYDITTFDDDRKIYICRDCGQMRQGKPLTEIDRERYKKKDERDRIRFEAMLWKARRGLEQAGET